MLLNATTNQQILMDVLRLDGQSEGDFDWDSIISSKDTKKT